MYKSKSKSIREPASQMTFTKSSFLTFKMLLVFPLVNMLLFIILIAYWNYDQYSDIRKRFKGYKNVFPEPIGMKKQNFFLLMDHLISAKQHS